MSTHARRSVRAPLPRPRRPWADLDPRGGTVRVYSRTGQLVWRGSEGAHRRWVAAAPGRDCYSLSRHYPPRNWRGVREITEWATHVNCSFSATSPCDCGLGERRPYAEAMRDSYHRYIQAAQASPRSAPTSDLWQAIMAKMDATTVFLPPTWPD